MVKKLYFTIIGFVELDHYDIYCGKENCYSNKYCYGGNDRFQKVVVTLFFVILGTRLVIGEDEVGDKDDDEDDDDDEDEGIHPKYLRNEYL